MTRSFALFWICTFCFATPAFAQEYEYDEVPPYEDDIPGWVEDENGGYSVSSPLPPDAALNKPSVKIDDRSVKNQDPSKFRFQVVNGDFWEPGKKRSRRQGKVLR